MSQDIRQRLATYTLDRYETEFADRHLLHGAVAKWAAETPEAIAIVDFDTGREFTYQRFDQTTTALALALLDVGYRHGDFLGTMLPLLPEHILLEYACFKIGVVHVPLDLRLKGAEVVQIAAYMRPSHYFMLDQGTFPLNRVSKTDYVQLAELAQAEVEKLRKQGGWDAE